MRELAQADPAEAELAEDGAWAAAAVAAGVDARRELLRAFRLDDQRLLGHALLIPSFFTRERKAEGDEQCAGLFVVPRAGRDCDVETADRGDRVIVDLRKDDLLADAERVVAAAVERRGVEPAELADAWEGDRDQPVHELPHPPAAHPHPRPTRHAFAHLEGRDGRARLPNCRTRA